MKPILIPTTDVNSDEGVVVEWFADDREWVERDHPLVEVETSKAVLEVAAPAAGYLLRSAPVGARVSITDAVGALFDSEEDLKEYERQQQVAAEAAAAAPATVRASVKAMQRAEELGVDLGSLHGEGLITVKDVEAAAALARPDYSTMPKPLDAEPGTQRIILIGAGLGATQVIDILRDSPSQKVVAIVDDTPAKWAEDVYDVPVVGGSDRLTEFFAAGAFDAAIVAISTSVPVRRMFRERLAQAGIPLANAIDRTARIAADAVLGDGNVICAFCQIGTSARIGDNNFFSAYNSYDHHNVLGSDISTGPSVQTSGCVTIGDRVRLGTGIVIEPHVHIGDDVQVASGATILRSVPADHVVKTKIVTTTVVPRRR